MKTSLLHITLSSTKKGKINFVAQRDEFKVLSFDVVTLKIQLRIK